MRCGYMVSLEIVVNVYLPVTIDHIVAAAIILQLCEVRAQFCDVLWDIAEDLAKHRRIPIEVYKYKRVPGLHPIRRQSHRRPVPIACAVELRLPEKTTIQR